MRAEQLAENYARAIYEAVCEKWSAALVFAQERLRKEPRLGQWLSDPSASLDEKRAAARSLLPEDSIPELENVLLALAGQGHLNLLDEVILEFEKLVKREAYREVARVVTAVPLSEEEREAIQQKIAAQFGTELDFDFRVDPSILGGVIVRVGGNVIDDSVAGKLTALRERLGVGEGRH